MTQPNCILSCLDAFNNALFFCVRYFEIYNFLSAETETSKHIWATKANDSFVFLEFTKYWSLAV